jgi:hypothetical protein
MSNVVFMADGSAIEVTGQTAVNDDITPAWQNGYAYAQRLHTNYGYDGGQIRDAADCFERSLYQLPEERADYDSGISAYLYLTFVRTA